MPMEDYIISVVIFHQNVLVKTEYFQKLTIANIAS